MRGVQSSETAFAGNTHNREARQQRQLAQLLIARSGSRRPALTRWQCGVATSGAYGVEGCAHPWVAAAKEACGAVECAWRAEVSCRVQASRSLCPHTPPQDHTKRCRRPLQRRASCCRRPATATAAGVAVVATATVATATAMAATTSCPAGMFVGRCEPSGVSALLAQFAENKPGRRAPKAASNQQQPRVGLPFALFAPPPTGRAGLQLRCTAEKLLLLQRALLLLLTKAKLQAPRRTTPCAPSSNRSARAASSRSPHCSSLGWWLRPVHRCRGRPTSRRCCTWRASLATPLVRNYLSSGRRSRSTRGPARDARRCSSAAHTDRGRRTARACAYWPGRGLLLSTLDAKRTAPGPPTCAPRQGVRSACSCC